MARKLPLNDPRWLPMKAAIELREQQTGALAFAIPGLEQEMAIDKLASMRRNLKSGERERLLDPFWKTHILDFSLRFDQVYRRTAVDDTPQRFGVLAHRAEDRLDDWAFFVWQPDLDRPYAQPQRKPTRKRKPGDVGRPPKFEPEQQQWLQDKYSLDLEADPPLKKHEAAIPHVKALAKTEFRIIAGRDVLLDDVIRPVLKRLKRKKRPPISS